MSNIIGIALSGLNAATTRVAVASNNIVNARSLGATDKPGDTVAAKSGGFRPQRVDQVSNGQGGALALTRGIDPASFQSFEPGSPEADANGVVPRPNVSLENQFMEITLAKRAYQASIRVIEVADAMLSELIDRRS